jgi:LysM repeat protein
MSRLIAVLFALSLTAAAQAAPLPHASGRPDGPGPGCGGGFTAARGDTLYSIARRCETTVTELMQENRLGHPPQLAAGQQLDIPGFSRRDSLVPPDVEAPSRPRQDRDPPMRVMPPPREAAEIYHFQAGDTLFSLARWARVSLAALRAANPDVDPRDIEAGDPIRLPNGAARPELLRARERGGAAVRPVAQLPVMPMVRPEAPRPPVAHPAPRPRDDDADKPKPDDDEDEDDGPTPGGMDDGRPAPDGM